MPESSEDIETAALVLKLEEALAVCTDPWKKKRFETLILWYGTDQTVDSIAAMVKLSRTQIYNILYASDTKSEEEILNWTRRKSRPARLSAEILAEIVRNRRQGILKSPNEIRQWLYKNHRITMSNSGVSYHLKKWFENAAVKALQANQDWDKFNFWVIPDEETQQNQIDPGNSNGTTTG